MGFTRPVLGSSPETLAGQPTQADTRYPAGCSLAVFRDGQGPERSDDQNCKCKLVGGRQRDEVVGQGRAREKQGAGSCSEYGDGFCGIHRFSFCHQYRSC